MKKTFAILTMLLFAVCGFMFGCDADKYDKLKIQLSSPNLVGDVLTLYYGQETDLAATVSGVGGINKSVYFSCSDPDALQFTKVNNTEDGTTVVVKALKPTYDNTFTLQAKSVENNTRYAEVKVKVILPIQGLDFLEKNGEMKNLAVSHSIPLDLFEQINFYPQTPYVTNQKSVVYSIINYGVNNPNDITIDNNGLLSVSANAIDNLVKLDPDNCLTIRVTSTDNTSIFNDIKVNVIRDIDISTVSYESSQISLNGAYDDKTNMVLFSNSELYYSETVAVTVQTGQEIDVTPIITGDNNVVEVTHLAGEDSYTSINGLITTRTQKFKIRAKSIRGISYVNFKIKIKNIANDMEYLLTDDARITVDVSGLPRAIDLKQNGTSYSNYSTLIIYDSYQTTQTTMAYGAKIVVNVSSESNSAVDELNKYLRIQVLDGDKDVSSYFLFSDANGLEITPTEGAFNVLSNNAFYVKATSNSIGKTFTLKVTTIIDKFVEYVNGSATGVQSEVVTNEYYLQSNYGVESIEPDQREYVLKLFTGQTAANVNKTKVHLTFNENADISNMQFSYDDEYVIVEKLDSNNYLLTGIKVTDNTNVTFTASNGFSRTIRVKIVQEVTDVLIKVDNPINSQVITQTANNINGRLATVSAKAGGRFNVYSVVAPHTSGIVSYNYTSSAEQIATINSSGVVVTRSAGEAIIEVTATYYRFEVNAEGYLSVVQDTIVNNFVLTVFIPSSSIKLNQTVINVYSADSLGFDYKSQSFIEIYALISPVTATIYSDESRVTYRLIGDNGNLVEVSRGMYQAFLPNGQDSATVMVVVTVDEYGTSTPLVCTVNITKAKQIKNISIDNVEKVQGRYVLNMRQDETHELAISYDPTDAYITEFKMVLIDYTTGEMYTDNNAVKLVTIDGHKIKSSPGTYPTDEDNAGEIYLRIFAKDSMTGSLSGKVYVDIYINVTDGSVNNPYIISNANELARIGDAPTKHYVLGNDIDMSGVNLKPMSAFSGTLNGYYYIKGIDGAQDISKFNKIENLSIDATNANNVGMFQEITSTGALFNLHLVVAKLYVSGTDTVANVGSFAGINNGLIMNCSVEIQDFIVESYNEILTSEVDYINVGGMVGQNKGYIFNFATSLGMSSEGSTLGLTTAELKDKEADYFADATFRTITQQYETGAIINDDDGLVIYNMTINEFVASHMPYTNYVDGVMVVRDSRYQYINAGGMVGQNMHIISGVYGIYNRIDESSFQEGGNQEIIFTATVQNQGVDSSVTITPNGAELKNRSSTFGGIVGYMSNDPTSSNVASIYNVSSSSNITGYNNVGGIVGKAEGVSSRKVTISTVLASGRISAYEFVGGAIGTIQQGIVGFVRVENYQNLSANGSNSLIEARNKVGGVIGSAQASNVSYIYSVTYVDGALGAYDIEVKNNDLEGYVGGLVGYSSGSTLTYSYSKLKLHAIVTVSSSIGGLVGFFDNGSKLSDCYFMGTVRAEVNATATSYYAQVIGEVGSTVSENDINYVYITGTTRFVGNKTNWFAGSTTVVGTKTAAVSMITGRDNWERDDDNINSGYPILQYTVNARMSFEALFIKLIPTSMRVVASNTIPEEVDAIKIDNSNMIIKYSGDDKDTHYNTYKITELFSVSVTPETIKQVSLIVTSSDPTIVKVTNNGELITMGTGRVTLTFVARLNTNITASVTLYVVQKVTSMQIYTNSNLTGTGLLYGTDDDGNPVINSVSVRKDGTQKLYPTFYCDDRVVYPDLDVNYVVDDTTYFEIVNNTIYGKAETDNMSAMVRVTQTIEGIAQPIVYHGIAADADKNSGVILVEQSDLEFYVRVFSGATDISVKPNNTIQITKYVPQQLNFTLVTDSSVDCATVKLTDDQGYVYSPVLTTAADGTVSVNGIAVFDQYGSQIIDETLIEQLVGGLKISISNYYFLLDASNSYSSNIAIEVRDGFEYTTTSSTYKLEIIAGSNELVNTSVDIEIVPQEMLHMDGAYYLFENLNNDSSGFVFSENPSNAIIPGRFGIFKANTAPVYSGIENFYIKTIGSQGYVNYSQLVLDNVKSILVDGDGRLEVYRFAPSLYVQESDTVFKLLRLSNYLGSEVEVLNEYKVTPSIKEENGRTYIKVAEVYDSTTATYNITYEIYDFDGNLYVQMVSSSGLYVVNQFDINLIAEYNDGRTSVYTHNFVVNDLPTIEITTSRDYISIVNAGAANGDTISVSASLSDGLTGEVTISQYGYRGMVEPTDASQYYNIAVLSGGVLSLKHVEDGEGNVDTNQSAQLGDTIVIVATYSINVDGKIETITAKKYIKVVDVVLEDVEISKVNIDNILSFTVSSTVELKASIVGYGESVEINNKSIEISRQLTTEGTQRISYWRYVRANGNTVNIDDGSLVLPFSINKTFVASDKAIISLVGSTQAGTVLMELAFYYYYTPNTEAGSGGILMFTDNPESVQGAVFYFSKQFTVQVNADSNADRPIPIYTQSDLYGMAEGGNYILMADITIESHTPITTSIASLDGNNKIITIKNFNYDDNSGGSVSNSINLGLFDTVAESTIIKNVIVAYQNNQSTPLNLANYLKINFGGIAAVNNGIITNCDVISVYPQQVNVSGVLVDSAELTSAVKYGLTNYTFNIQSSVQIDGTLVETHVGGFVGQNSSTGRITNSRVGRETVNIVTPRDNNGTTYGEAEYAYTAPVTLMRVSGSGSIGGFAGANDGIISSCYFKNGQIEITTYGSTYTQVAGFVADNTGAVYGSYAAGWEEDKFISTGVSGGYLLSQGTNAEGNTQEVTLANANASRRMGGGLYSNANIAGFVYSNGGVISNSYSALNLNGNPLLAANRNNITSSLQLTEYGNLNAGGFVFTNLKNARIETSYSISKLKSKITTHGAFVGIAPISGDVQNEGTVDKCYFLLEIGEDIYDDYDPAYSISQSIELDLGDSAGSSGNAVLNTNEFIETGSFSGFSFDNNNYSEGMVSGAIWAMHIFEKSQEGSDLSNFGYPELISANSVAISLRVLRVDDANPTAYSYIYVQDFEKGSLNNPQLITSAAEYNNLFTDILNSSSNIENVNVKYTGNIRLVTNIDFAGVTVTSSSFEYSSLINTTSIFDGNNMYMYNLLLSDESATNTAFGLFKSLNSVGVKNLSLTINKVSSTNGVAVGGLAGVIVDSDINNINIVAATEGASVSGKNFVGGLAGIILSSEADNLHYANNIQSNVAVLASYTTESNPNFIKSGEIWSYIIPPAKIEGSVSSDNNLRLQYLPTNVSYAGGIAGVVDLLQAFESEGADDGSGARQSLSKVNVRSANVGNLELYTASLSEGVVLDNPVNIEAEFAGGLFGFIGQQTYFKEGYFLVYEASQSHYINSTVAAGGIAAINYGFIEQVHVSHDESTQLTLDGYLQSLVSGTTNISRGNEALYTGKPTYLGGIAGINIGSRYTNSGSIKNCYNRVDVKNIYATRVGGIVGATHVGSLTNVFTTATVMGDLTNRQTYLGQIIGQLLDNTNNSFFVETVVLDKGDSSYELELANVVAINAWNSADYDALKAFTDNFGINYTDVYGNTTKVKIGAIYAPYHDETNAKYKTYEGYVKDFGKTGSSTFLFDKIYKGYNKNTDLDFISLYTGCETLTGESNNKLYYYVQQNPTNIITQDVYKDLMTVQAGVVSNAKQTIFTTTVWSDRVWLFDDTRALITLKFGYIPNVSRIYTAEEFLSIINEDPASSRTYVIMNDLDFSKENTNLTGQLINIGSNFRGKILGNTVKDEDGNNARKPILFNLEIQSNGKSDTSLFTSTTNARFEGFNIVLSDYIEDYKKDPEAVNAVNTRSSILLGNATNTVVNNVHIYSNIQHIASSDYLKLRIKDSDEDYYYTYSTSDDVEDDDEGKYLIYRGSGNNKNVIKNNKDYPIVTSANYFGGFVANGNSMTIIGCTFNVNIRSQYKSEILPTAEGSAIYFGGLAGRYLGTIETSQITSNIDFAYNSAEHVAGVEMMYIGGAVGYLSGSLTGVSYRANSFNVDADGELSFKIGGESNYVANTANMYIGGIAGSAQKLNSADSDLVSKVQNVTVENVEIIAYLGSTASIGGVIGINEWEAEGLVYKNTNSDVDNYNNSDPGAVIESGGEQDLSVYTDVKTDINIGGVVGYNTYSQIVKLNTNANIYYKDNSAYDAVSHKVNIGGIIGFSNSVTLLSAVQESHTILADSNGGDFTGIGGLIGKINDAVTANELAIMYSISTVDVVVKGSDTYVVAGGFVGDAEPSVLSMTSSVVYSTVSILSKKVNEPNAKALVYGGVAGKIKKYENPSETNGTVVAVTLYYPDIANIEVTTGLVEYSIGQLFGVVTEVSTTNPTHTLFEGLFYNETLFAMYINKYYSYTVNEAGSIIANYNQSIIDKETKDFIYENAKEERTEAQLISLSERVNLIISHSNAQNLLSSHITTSLAQKTTVYTRLAQYLQVDSGVFSQVSGTKLNPIKVTGSGVSFEAYKHYELIADYTISSPITLNKGVFLRANGFTIKCNNYTNYVFENIGEYAIVSGLLVQSANISGVGTDAASPVGILAKNNSGMIISCGTSGTISGKYVSGLVGTNKGIIIDSFSIAAVTSTTNGTAAGLVSKNEGSVISCHATGLISSTTTGSSSGFVDNNTGKIASCYTVSNLFGGENSYDNLYPFARTSSGTLKYNYYDENAYTGDHKAADNNTSFAPTQTSKLTNIYAMNDSGQMAKNLSINGNWYENSYPNRVIQNSNLKSYYTDNTMTNTWFNYGYGLINSDYTIGSYTGKARLLNMLYTGNGKQEGTGKTNGFENSPYQITNAGIFEAFVLGDHAKGAKSYYILMNDISFAAYDNWSDSWDENGVFFRGDFNGNNKTLKDLNSKHGLFRVFAEEAYAYNFTITEAYSQTGILAAYMTSDGDVAKIENVTIKTTKLEGKTENVSNKNIAKFNPSPTIDGVEAFNDHFAGGLVGYMAGGVLDDVDIVEVDDEAFVIKNTRDDGYAGGYVGYYTGGVIKPTDKTDVFKNAATVVVEGPKAGAYIGYAYDFKDSGLVVETNANVTGYDTAAGFIAEAASCELTNCSSEAVVDGASTSAGFVGHLKDSTLTTCKYLAVGLIVADSYAGGLVGTSIDSTIKNCEVNTTKNITSSLYAGGLVAHAIDTTITYDNSTAANPVTVETISATYGAGGLVGGMAGTTITGTSTNVLISDNKVTNNSGHNQGTYLGGIVGRIYTISSADNPNANTTSSTITNVKNTGEISNTSVASDICPNIYIGGLVGGATQTTTISNSNNNGTFSIPNDSSTTIAAIDAGGIIGYAGSTTAVVKLLTVTNTANMSGFVNNMGGIVGRFIQSGSDNTFDNVTNSGTINNTSTNEHSISNGEVTTVGSTAGGIVGYATGAKINNANNHGAVTGVNAGGIVSVIKNGTIKASTNNSAISGSTYAGGIVATAQGTTIETCINASSGTINSSAGIAGGIVAIGRDYKFAATITNNAEVTGKDTAGGVVGYSNNLQGYKTIENKGSTISAEGKVGGVFGQFIGGVIASAGDLGPLTVSSTATAVKATGDNSFAGGIIGEMLKGSISSASAMTLSDLTLSGSNVGGFIGVLSATEGDIVLSEVKANNNFTFDNSGKDFINAGGIVGLASKGTYVVTLSKLETVSSKTITAKSTIAGASVGGVAGKATSGISFATCTTKISINIENSLTSGKVNIGGLVGTIDTVTVTDAITKNVISLGTMTAANYASGLIAGTSTNSDIKNTTIESGASITGTVENTDGSYVGGVVGFLQGGSIEFESSAAGVESTAKLNPTISVNACVGGIVGKADSSYQYTVQSTNKKYKIAGSLTGYYVGGIVGRSASSKGSTINAFNVAFNTVTGGFVGGVVGYATSGLSVTNCNVSITTLSAVYSGDYTKYTGGVVGYSEAELTVSSCKVTSQVDGSYATYAGGIVGYATTTTITISSNSVEGNIYGASYAGGILGGVNVNGTVSSNTITTGSKRISASNAGGIIGHFLTGASELSVSGNKVQNQTINGSSAAGAVVGEFVGTLVSSGNGVFGDTYSEYKDCKLDGGTSGFFAGKLTGGSSQARSFSVSTSQFTGFNIDTTYFGTVAGYISGTYSQITCTYVLSAANIKEIYSTGYLGGIIGYLDASSTLSNCTAASGSKISSIETMSVGGIIGYAGSAPETKNCYSDAGIDVKAYEVGGICGYSYNSSFSGCTTVDNGDSIITRDYSGSNTAYAGGIVGYLYSGSVTSCTNYKLVAATASTITDNHATAGGIVGYAGSSTISSCTNTGAVTSKTRSSGTYTEAEAITSGTVYTSDYSYWSRAGGIAGDVYNTTLTSNTNSATSINGTYDIKTSSGYVSRNTFEWVTFEKWQDKALGFIPTTIHYKINLRFRCTTGGITGDDSSSTYSNNSTTTSVPYHSYTKGRGFSVSGTNENEYLWDWFKPSKVNNELYVSLLDYIKNEGVHSSTTI